MARCDHYALLGQLGATKLREAVRQVRRDRRQASLRNAPTVSLVGLSGYVAVSALLRITGSIQHETERRQERPR